MGAAIVISLEAIMKTPPETHLRSRVIAKQPVK
jgi:hypothetical protein